MCVGVREHGAQSPTFCSRSENQVTLLEGEWLRRSTKGNMMPQDSHLQSGAHTVVVNEGLMCYHDPSHSRQDRSPPLQLFTLIVLRMECHFIWCISLVRLHVSMCIIAQQPHQARRKTSGKISTAGPKPVLPTEPRCAFCWRKESIICGMDELEFGSQLAANPE